MKKGRISMNRGMGRGVPSSSHRGEKGIFFFSLIFILTLLFVLPLHAVQNETAIREGLKTARLPFIENRGQVSGEVAYYAPTFGGTVFVTKKGEIVYSLPKVEAKGKRLKAKGERRKVKRKVDLLQ